MLQVLGVPLAPPSKAAVVHKLLGTLKPRIPRLQGAAHATIEDSLEGFLQHVGPLFGKDPSKWEQIGERECGGSNHAYAALRQAVQALGCMMLAAPNCWLGA